MGDPPARILLVEPYLTGSHRAWAEGLVEASRHRLRLLALPGRFWKWRMHGAALTAARRLRAWAEEGWRPDLVLATDMLDLASFLGLTRDLLAGRPSLLYMHENQLAYPQARPEPGWSASRRRRAAGRDLHYPFVNLSAALAADQVWWNSAHNRDSFLAALPGFLGSFPDFREPRAVEQVAARSRVLPLGLALAGLDAARPASREPGPPRILWNHRWEHDKDPERFFAALDRLDESGLDFELVLLGESFVRVPPAFEAARQRHGARIRHFGFAESRQDYARWLWQSDIVVSTARHEFFGAAVCEALYCGCRPLLPRRLSYPELLGERHAAWLYEPEELEARLAALIQSAAADPRLLPDPRLRDRAASFDWSVMAARYDRALSEAIRSGPRPPMLY